MAFPEIQQGGPVGVPVDRPVDQTRLLTERLPAFRLYVDRLSADRFDLPYCRIGDVEVQPGTYWLCTPIQVNRTQGANGVRTGQAGVSEEVIWEKTEEHARKHGRILLDPHAEIPTECLPPGVPAGGYLRKWHCKEPGTGAVGLRHTQPWDIPGENIPGVKVNWSFDRVRYGLWLYWLTATGVMPNPSQAVVAEARKHQRSKVTALAVKPLPESVRGPRLEIAEERAAKAETAHIGARPPGPTAEEAAIKEQLKAEAKAEMRARLRREAEAEAAEELAAEARAKAEAAEAKKAEEARKAEEKRQAEEKKAEERRLAEAKKAEEKRAADAKKAETKGGKGGANG